MLTTIAALVLSVAPAQAPAEADGNASLPLHPRIELGAGLGVVNQDVGLIPRLRLGASFDVGVVNLVVGGDIAGEAFLTGENNEGFGQRSYWEALLTPRLFVGYEIALGEFSFVPYGYLAVSGGFRNTTRRFFGREDTATDIAFGGRLGLGLGFVVQMFLFGVELDAGWRDLGPSGSATLNAGIAL